MNKEKEKINALKNKILSLLKDEVEDLWKKEDIEFLDQIAKDIARERVLLEISDNSEVHKKYCYSLH